MNILDIAIIIFIFLESSNILLLYFKPTFKYGNSMAPFKAYAKLQKSEKDKLFVKYLTNWVANTKLIFIALLIVILFTASDFTKFISLIVLIITVSAYYIRLHPIIKKLDDMDEIEPKGYSKTLMLMISGFISLFVVALLVHLLMVY